MNDWKKEAQKFHNDETGKEEYDRWRYRFPEFAEHALPADEQPIEERLGNRRGLRELLKDKPSGVNPDAFRR